MHFVSHTNFSYLLLIPFRASLTFDVNRRSECVLIAGGFFKQDIPSIRLSFNISTDTAGGSEPVLIVEDEFCDWVDVDQGGTRSCPPKKGPAVLSFKLLLMQGWIPEVRKVLLLKNSSHLSKSHAGKIRP